MPAISKYNSQIGAGVWLIRPSSKISIGSTVMSVCPAEERSSGAVGKRQTISHSFFPEDPWRLLGESQRPKHYRGIRTHMRFPAGGRVAGVSATRLSTCGRLRGVKSLGARSLSKRRSPTGRQISDRTSFTETQ